MKTSSTPSTHPTQLSVWSLFASRTRLIAAALWLTTLFTGTTTVWAQGTPQIIYVVPGGTGDGSSWAQGRDLAPALAAAPSGSELWVKRGTYRPAGPGGDRNATFLINSGVAVYGGFAGSETTRANRDANPTTNGTILSGDLNGDDGSTGRAENSYNVVAFIRTDATALLDGFTITGGNADNPERRTGEGGGIYCFGASPTLTNLIVRNNSAFFSGGGIYLSQSGFAFERDANPVLVNVKIRENSASGSGGGMFNDRGRFTMINGEFSGNTGRAGGGIFTVTEGGTLSNVVLSGNAANQGGAVFSNAATPTFINVTISGNNGGNGVGGIESRISGVICRNCIVWGNSGTQIAGQATLVNSIVQGGAPGALVQDPLFVTPITATAPTVSGNLRLQAGSPAINAGDNSVVTTATDLDRNPRILGASVDLGAYEFLSPTDTPARLYVDAAVQGGNATGDSWTNASPTLSFALARALSGTQVTEIWVAKGTYTPAGPNGDRNATFQLRNNLAIYGGFTSGQTQLAQRDANPTTNGTILSGDLNGNDDATTASTLENSVRIVTGSDTDPTALLSGFTISGGFGTSPNPFGRGSGMYILGGSPTLANLAFTNNRSSFGGAMYIEDGSPRLQDVRFSGNRATSSGGGIYVFSGSPQLDNVLFSGNLSNSGGGGILLFSTNSAQLTNVTFSGNSGTSGGAISIISSSGRPTLRNCVLWGNSAGQINGVATVVDSIVQGGVAGTNVLNQDPQFIQPITVAAPTTTGNLRLTFGSPAINAGNNSVVTAANDLDGNPRIGAGTVDFGAYEYTPPATPTFAGLTNGGVTAPSGSGTLNLAVAANPSVGGGTFTSSNLPAGSIVGGVFNASGVPAGVYQVTYTFTDSLGYSSSATFNLTVAETPSLVVTTDRDDSTAVDGITSLREAIAYANTGNAGANPVIAFDAALKGKLIRLGSTLPQITRPVTIQGDIDGDAVADITITGDVTGNDKLVAGSTTITDIAASHTANVLADNVRIFSATADLSINGLELSGGVAPLHGGAINTTAGVMVSDSIISGNSAEIFGGGIYAKGPVKVSNSTFNANFAKTSGGGIQADQAINVTNATFNRNFAEIQGGGILTNSTARVSDSVFSGNTAQIGVGGGTFAEKAITVSSSRYVGNSGNSGGGIYAGNSAEVSSSTFSNNSSVNGGGGIFSFGAVSASTSTFSGNSAGSGGGIFTFASVRVSNSTFSGNSSQNSGGGIRGGGTFSNSTFSGNSARSAGGGISGGGTFSNSIVLGNSAQFEAEIAGTVTAAGPNIIGGANAPSLDAVFAAVSVNPFTGIQSGTLADNGGPTQTIALARNSPAIDAASANLTTTTAAVAAGVQTVAVADGKLLLPGLWVAILDPGQTTAEVVQITAVSGNSFTANFPQAHPANAQVILATDQRDFDRPVNNRNDIGAYEAAFTTISGPATTPSFGDSFTVTATVANAMATGNEKVQFVVDGTNYGAPVPLTNGAATSQSLAGLNAGNRQITAIYLNGNGVAEGNSNPLSQTIKKATIAVSFPDPQDITYPAPLGNPQLNAVLSVATPGTFTFTPAAGTVLEAGNGQTLSVSFVPTDTANYNSPAVATAKINVLKGTATLNLPATTTVTYDGTAKAVAATVTPSGLSGVTVTYTGTNGTSYPASTTAPTNAGTYTVTATLDNANYVADAATGTLTIAKATPVLSWSNPADITFGTALGATQLNATVSPAIAGTFTYSPAAGTVLEAGAAQTLTVSFTPADAENYNTPAAKTVAINVLKAPATLDVPATTTATFDGTAKAVAATVTPSGLNGVTVTYTGTNGTTYPASTTAPTNAGTYSVTATLDNANYVADAATGTLTIAKATPVLNWSNPADITFGTALGATQLNATVSPAIAGTFTYSPAAGTVLNAGAGQTLSVSFAPADAENYNAPANATVLINVLKAPATLNLPATTTATFDGTAKAVAATTEPAGLSGVTVTYTGTNGTTYPASTTAPTNAGTYTVTTTLDNANYVADAATGTLTIAKATPVLSWSNPADITFGTALSATQLNATVSPAIGGTFTYSPAAGTVLNAGAGQTLSVNFTPADAENYNAPANATVLINVARATATLTLDAASLTQLTNGTPRAVPVTTTPAGLSGVTVTYTGINGTTYPTSTTAPTNAGSYAVSATLTNANYVAEPVGGTLVLRNPATTTTLAASKNPSAVGDAVTFTATVAPAAATGTVQFQVDGVNVGAPVAVSNGRAVSAPVASLTAGSRAISAVFTSNTGNFNGSTGTLTQAVGTPNLQVGWGFVNGSSYFLYSTLPLRGGTSAGGYVGYLTYGDLAVPGGFFFGAATITDSFTTDRVTGTITGTGSVNGVAGFTFIATVEDRGTPGGGRDRFRLQVFQANGTLRYDSNAQPGVNGGLLTLGEIFMQPALDTTTAVSSSKNPSAAGEAVTFTATVTPAAATGTVQFRVDGVNLGAPVAVSNGRAVSAPVSTLAAGSRAISAVFTSNNAVYNGSSGALTQRVGTPVTLVGWGLLSPATYYVYTSVPVPAATSASGYVGYVTYGDLAVPGGFFFGATTITSGFTTDRITATITGTGSVNGVGGFTFIATPEDRGTPGAGRDRFRLQVFNPNGTLRYDSNAQPGVNAGLLVAGENQVF